MPSSPRTSKPEWELQLAKLLPLYGHRNWIVVADSAYPAQSKPGIDTVVSRAQQLEVTRKVLDAINASRHVRAAICLDKELDSVTEADAPGITRYRSQLGEMLKNAKKTSMPHEQIIGRLDEVSEVFRVLIIKTESAIPYTSVFFELGCAYWPAAAEERRRKATGGTAR